MEKDRALNLLQNGLLPQVHGAYYEALKMVIDDWKTEPCEDAISRQAVLDLPRITLHSYWGKPVSDVLLIEDIKKLPPVQPEPFINKPCVSEQACREDKVKVLEKIRAELERRGGNDEKTFCKSLNESYKLGLREAIEIINKYIADKEDE